MPNCECLPGCPFFNDKMKDKPATAEMMKRRYCLDDNSGCARHMVFAARGRGSVPMDLMPAQIDKAQALLAM